MDNWEILQNIQCRNKIKCTAIKYFKTIKKLYVLSSSNFRVLITFSINFLIAVVFGAYKMLTSVSENALYVITDLFKVGNITSLSVELFKSLFDVITLAFK